MKATELKLEEVGYYMNANIKPANSHYKFLMSIGRVFPNNKAQAQQFVSNGQHFDVLNKKDVERVEELMNSQGFKGDYSYTKSKAWVRLTNANDFHKALKLKYGF